MHLSLLLLVNLPGLHFIHEDEPAVLKEPSSQEIHVLLRDRLNLPALQMVHEAAWSPLKRPA